MARFFNREYTYAYKRGSKVWVSGTVQGSSFRRMSTGKEFSMANMNWVEKNWATIIRDEIERKSKLADRTKVLSLKEFIPISLELNQDSADPHTLKSYRGVLDNHIIQTLGHLKLDEINANHIIRWQTMLRVKKKLSQKTIINARAVLSGVFRNAIQEGIIQMNPISITKAPNKKQFIQFDDEGKVTDLKGNEIIDKIDPFSYEEIKLLIANASGQFKNIITVLFYTGMRPGEMVTLRWGDIDWENKTIHIQRARKRDTSIGTTKNGKTRKVTILPPVLIALKEQYRKTGMNDGFIFLNQYNERYHDYDILRDYHWKNLLKRSGFDYRSFYQTKHSFASMMLQAGEDITWVSQVMLGHSEISTTLKYYAKYVKSSNKKHASFLYDERTNSVQLKSNSA